MNPIVAGIIAVGVLGGAASVAIFYFLMWCCE